MSPQPVSEDPERKPTLSPALRALSLSSRRGNPRASFTLDLPQLTDQQRASLQRSRRSNSAMSPASASRAGSASASAPPTTTANKDDAKDASSSTGEAGDAQQGSAQGVWKILSVQRGAGIEDRFLCILEEGGNRKVQRTRSALLKTAPDVLAEYEAANPSSPSSPAQRTDSGDSDVVVLDRLRSTRASTADKGKGKGKARAVEEDGDEDMEDSGKSDDEADETMEEPSSPSEDDDDSADEDEDDFAIGCSLRTRKSKPEQRGTRHSSRNDGRSRKHCDFGDGKGARDDSDDEADGSSSSGRRTTVSTRSTTRRSTRASTGSSAREEQSHDSGESSDELGMQAKPRKQAAPPPRKNRAVVADSDDYEDVDELELSSSSSQVDHTEESLRPQDQHYQSCAKCKHEPASELLRKFHNRKSKKKTGRPRKRDELEEDTDAEGDRLTKLGSWIECGVCCSAYHFGCLPAPQKRQLTDLLKTEHEQKYSTTVTPVDGAGEGEQPEPVKKDVPKRHKIELDADRTFSLAKCPACKKQGGRRCFVCGISGRRVTERELVETAAKESTTAGYDKKAEEGVETATGEKKDAEAVAVQPGLMFRCTKCKRVAHYGCLDNDEPAWSFEQHCQSYYDWAIDHDCYNYNVALDVILAWAEADPLPNAEKDQDDSDDEAVEAIVGERRVDEKTKKVYDIPSAKDLRANAKYLVKWQEMSYRHLDWVPHAFLAAAYPAKLSNFLARGSTVKFDAAVEDDPEEGEPEEEKDDLAPLPDPDALKRIPPSWRTVERVIEVWYRHPKKAGEQLAHDHYIRRYDLPENPEDGLELVMQCKLKWGDLPYGQCTDEAPPKPDEEGYEAYVAAYKAFLVACSPEMSVPSLTKKQMAELDQPRDPKRFKAIEVQPDYITGGKLMDFQLAGLNFLYYQWWQRTGCILADEMGLGKTCQIISFLSLLNKKEGARPFLVAVPNSLVGNWMREFQRWAPSMRVVAYNGDADSRKIVEDYELFDSHGSLKTHVVVVTYEALAQHARVFRRVDRWDALVVDEGQRLKAGKDSQLYSAIASLNISHRVLLSGTPLNNNLREVFNLLSFINPTVFPDVDMLTEKYAELNPQLVEEVREMLKPYFLRRTKNLVLNLPPLLDVVVPVSMTVLQRSVYRGILERNAAAIHSIAKSAGSTSRKPKKGGFNNILMELRKTLCHPYLTESGLEPRQASAEQAHINLMEACGKFVLLQRMLPKLKAAGHRVLIFSQFKITLNIIERFLNGLKLKYLRLDGDTPQLDRQRDVDKYNAPGSEYFAYLLSTRVGLNITSADVVIIYDQDFNPQMDLQAISRAHRIGQTKPVRVFKLLVKGTCEERIFNAGNKKLGLEHLIIQRIDAKDESEDVESMLQFGAQAVFDEAAAEAAAIRYTDADIDDLLKKTAEPSAQETEAAGTFAQAQVWTREKGLDDASTLEAGQPEAEQGKDLHDFWSKVVADQQEAERRLKAQQASNVGRGKRKRAEVNYRLDKASPQKKETKKVGSNTPSGDDDELSSGDDYRQRAEEPESDDEWAEPMDLDDLPRNIIDNDPLRAPLPLARVEPGTSTSNPAVPPLGKKKKNKAGQDPNLLGPEDAQALTTARESVKVKAEHAIDALMRSAQKINQVEAVAMLQEALISTSRSKQAELLTQAAKLIRARARAIKKGPLAPIPAATDQGLATGAYPNASSSYAHAPNVVAPFSSSKQATPVQPSHGEKRATSSKPEKAPKAAEIFPPKASASASTSSSAPSTAPKPAEPTPDAAAPARKSIGRVPKAAKEAKEQAQRSPPTPAAGSVQGGAKDVAGSSSSAAMQRATSGGAKSDSSGDRSTPKFKQPTLAFVKKPSPPTNATSSGFSSIPAKRPSPTSSAPAPKRPTPPKASTSGSSAKKPEPIVLDLISDSE
ncbi:hypothetical protein JCM10207_004569 [Rhodosporidiobolus poonsookiae]